jgi:polyhydroxyalkanoate synthesis regulator protein
MMQVVMLLEDGQRPLFSHSFLTQLIQCHALGTWDELGQYLDECMKSFVARSRTGTDEPALMDDEPLSTAHRSS